MKNSIKTWAPLIITALIQALLVVLFIISEAKTDSTFLRVLTGLGTLLPVGALIPFLIKETLNNTSK